MYNKLFTKILDSSIWLEPTPTRIVWLTFIAVMDEAGFVQFASVKNVAHRARVTINEAEAAITCLEAPDGESSNPENDGRRIERVPGGWMVLNAATHRELVTRERIQHQTRERVRRFRERLKSEPKRTSNALVTTSEAIAVAKERSESREEQERAPRLATPIIGKNPHLQHAYCDPSLSYCVPSAVHHKLADLIAPKHAGDRDAAKTALMAWYPTIVAKMVEGFVMGDAFRFWQTVFDDAFVQTPRKAQRLTESVESMTEGVREILKQQGVFK